MSPRSPIHCAKGSVIFYQEGGLSKFFKFCKFLVIPHTVWVKFFWSPLMYCRIQVIPPHHHLIIKAAKLVSVFEADIDHPLGLLKVKAGNLKGILIVVRVNLQNSHHIISFTWLTRNLEDNFPYHGNRGIFPYLSCLIWYRGNSWLEKQFLCMVARVNKLPWQQDESLSQPFWDIESSNLVYKYLLT